MDNHCVSLVWSVKAGSRPREVDSVDVLHRYKLWLVFILNMRSRSTPPTTPTDWLVPRSTNCVERPLLVLFTMACIVASLIPEKRLMCFH
ncbi:unnamed protein product [Fusarium graminearum]|uniref:Uncharacterized protein n=1 Tax=Gibberella zeae TaxID=5518 RepID=A0A4V6J6X5_GIBZA|nr:unnamed protein product [Fusarium graminearum]CAF3652275.1 unnamed protein product [Fusarium graminearum]VTO82040.1 unnamed protein product [Fusarium graminearum]